MKQLRNLIVLALFVCANASAVEAGDSAPAFRAFDFDGQAVEFPRSDTGATSVVIFWATWCGYCKAFMPKLEQIEADYRSRGVQVVAINAKEDGSGNPAQYIADLQFPMTAVRSGNGIARAWNVEFIPGVFVVDSNGVVAFRRPWTDLPAGEAVADLWDRQVRRALDTALE
ncbi:MAG TPA: TlpA disulfide reductase family protein [Gammaproteobacteria bacterium]|nr:TlpA disulfide reductase family protein [Gammaproteobacteria bacterium]